jgi:hypothetical protein
MAKKRASRPLKPVRSPRARRDTRAVLPAEPVNVEGLFNRVAAILDQARAAVVRSVNNHMVLAYWHIAMIGRSTDGG